MDNEEVVIDQQVEDPLQKELSSLKNKNTELLSDLAKLKQYRNSIDELGGLDHIREIIKSKKEKQEKALEESGDLVAIKRQYQDEIASLQAKVEKFNNEKLQSRIDEKLRGVVESSGGAWELVSPVMKKFIKTEVYDDDIVYQVLDDSGHSLIKEGRDAKIEDLVDKLRNDPLYGRAFERSSTKTGSGAIGSKRKPESNPWLKESLDLANQTKIWLDNPERARRMMAEAGVKPKSR
jgi:hypothetical protein